MSANHPERGRAKQSTADGIVTSILLAVWLLSLTNAYIGVVSDLTDQSAELEQRAQTRTKATPFVINTFILDKLMVQIVSIKLIIQNSQTEALTKLSQINRQT